MSDKRRGSFGVLGVGAAACAACCAPPVLAFLGGLGLAGLASTLIFGALGLILVAVAVAGVVLVRRHRTANTLPPSAAVPVQLTARRPAP